MRTISSHFPASQQIIILPSIGAWRTALARIPDVEAAAYVLPYSISHQSRPGTLGAEWEEPRRYLAEASGPA